MRLLVARAPNDAAPLTAQLAVRGHDCVVVPLYRVVTQPLEEGALERMLVGVQALLLTSANGVRALAAATARRDIAVFAVGDATAMAARNAGFAAVESAGGNVEDLAKLVSARLKPENGSLFHAAARHVAGDLQGMLDAAGFTVRRSVLYEAQPLGHLPDEALIALRGNTVDAALFFSPRSAASFVRLAAEAGLRDSCRSIRALCLSDAVAEAVGGLAWADTKVAARADTPALLDLVDQMASKASGAERTDGITKTHADQSKAKDGQLDDKQEKAANTEGSPGQPRATDTDEAPALAVISAFGGIRPMAAKLSIAVSTVQGWRERAAIPQARHEEIMAAARTHDVELDAGVLAASDKPQTARPQEPGTAAGSSGSVPQSGKLDAADARKSGESNDTARKDEASRSPQAVPRVASAPPRRGGAGWAFFLLGGLVFAAGIAAAVVTQPHWAPLIAEPGAAPEASALAERLSALEAGLGEVDAQLEQLATAQPVGAGDGAAVAELRDVAESLASRLDALEAAGGGSAESGELGSLAESLQQLDQRLAAVEQGAGQGGGDAAAVQSLGDELNALASQFATLEGRLGTIESAQNDLRATMTEVAESSREAMNAPSQDAMLALAIAQLRDALRDGTGFAAELQQLRAVSQSDSALASLLDPLAPYAKEGAPSLEALQRSFPAVARSAAAAAQGDGTEGWLGGVLRRVSGVVTVRPVGEVAGESPGAIIARAEARVEAGDLAGALAELDALQGPSADAVAEWRGQAEARLAAEQALSQLSAHVISKLGAAGG